MTMPPPSYDEILVGAPLYSESDGIEKGRVFIFKNNVSIYNYYQLRITCIFHTNNTSYSIMHDYTCAIALTIHT